MAVGNRSFDAIVVGTGISGGWAAKELTEKGLKTLMLDRGRMVKHGEYPTATKKLWELPYAGRPTQIAVLPGSRCVSGVCSAAAGGEWQDVGHGNEPPILIRPR